MAERALFDGSSATDDSCSDAPSLARLEQPCELKFEDISYEVTTKDGRRLQILQKVSGMCRSGRLTAVMGSSGAGKSTLLKVLACNITGGSLRGVCCLNGRPIVRKDFRKASVVVWQRDLLLPTVTVREALMTSAQLRLPQSMPVSEKRARVDQIIIELGLRHVQDTVIGEDRDAAITGISGGERRRVSVGMGLVTDPRAIFLDEPTTGLDSDSALTLMEVLAHLAAKGRTVVASIHQPSGDITQLFDDVMLLSLGRMVYRGEWSCAAEFVDMLGYKRTGHKSLAEHLLTVSKTPHLSAKAITLTEGIADARAHLFTEPVGVPSLADIIREHLSYTAEHKKGDAVVLNLHAAPELDSEVASSLASTCSVNDDYHAEVRTSRCHQVRILSARFFTTWWRSPINLLVQLAQYIFFAIMLGATYWQIPANLTSGPFDRVASLWFATAVAVLQPAANASSIINMEKDVLRRELSNGMYRFSSFYIAKGLTSLPFQLFFATIFTVGVYFSVGYQATALKFFAFFLIVILLMLISETMGTAAGAIHRSPPVGLILVSAICLLLMMYTGFIQTHTPVYFVWLKKASFVTHAYAGLVHNEFDGLVFSGPDGIVLPGLTEVPSNCTDGLSYAKDVAILIGILIGLRLATFWELLLFIHCNWL